MGIASCRSEIERPSEICSGPCGFWEDTWFDWLIRTWVVFYPYTTRTSNSKCRFTIYTMWIYLIDLSKIFGTNKNGYLCGMYHVQGTVSSSPCQRLSSFWSAPRIATSEKVQHRKSAHAQQIWNDYFTHVQKIGTTRGRHSWCWPKGVLPLETIMKDQQPQPRSQGAVRWETLGTRLQQLV